MNKEMILKVADAIEHDKLDGVVFNMAWFVRPFDEEHTPHSIRHRTTMTCGTACCMAGYTLVCNGASRKSSLGAFSTDEFMHAPKLLGLDYFTQGKKLFFGKGSMYENELDLMPAAYAAKTLRHLAETGNIVWFDDEII